MENADKNSGVYPSVRQGDRLNRWLLEVHQEYSFIGEVGQLAVLSAYEIAPEAKVIKSHQQPSLSSPLEILIPSTNMAYVAQAKDAVKDSLSPEAPVDVHRIKNTQKSFSVGPWLFGRGFYWDEGAEQLYLRGAGMQTPLPNEALEPWKLHYGEDGGVLQVLNPYSMYGLAVSGIARVNSQTTAALRDQLFRGNYTIGNIPPEYRKMVLAYYRHAQK